MIPTKLAYNVFQIFEHNGVTLKLKNGEITILEEDVFDVLDLSHGEETISLGSQEKHKAKIDSWLSNFETTHITVSTIIDIMKQQPLTEKFQIEFTDCNVKYSH